MISNYFSRGYREFPVSHLCLQVTNKTTKLPQKVLLHLCYIALKTFEDIRLESGVILGQLLL